MAIFVSLLLWQLWVYKIYSKLFRGHLSVEIPGLSWYMGLIGFAVFQPFLTAFSNMTGLILSEVLGENKTDGTQV